METNFSKCILSIDEDEGEEIALRRANNIVGKLFPRTRSKRITKAPLCFRDQSPPRYCRDDTIPPEQSPLCPASGYLAEDKDKGYEKLFGQRQRGNFSLPAEIRRVEVVCGESVPTGLNLIEKCFPTKRFRAATGALFPTSFRQIWLGTRSRNEEEGSMDFSNSPSDNWKHCCWLIPSSALAPHPSVPMTSSSYHISRQGDRRLITRLNTIS